MAMIRVPVSFFDASPAEAWQEAELLDIAPGWALLVINAPVWVQWDACHPEDRDKLRLSLWAKQQSMNGGHRGPLY